MVKKTKNILISGCSFSANNEQSGWKKKNLYKQYSNILNSHKNISVNNIAIGGCSNKEIFYRTIDEITKTQYDFCIVQWSSLHRLWLYESENNIDDESQILPFVSGKITHKDEATQLHKIITSYYSNSYVALKHWLLDQISLQNFFEKNNIKYVFLRGFPNYADKLEEICKKESLYKNQILKPISKVFIPDPIKNILCFDDNPDYYLQEKIQNLLTLYTNIDKRFCIGYNTNTNRYGLDVDTYELENDLADDGMHPGEKTNQIIANKLLKIID